jgi:hypothetical protein
MMSNKEFAADVRRDKWRKQRHVIRNNSAHHFGPALNRGASELALQRSLGSSTGRYPRTNPDRGVDTRSNGSVLII